MRGLNLVRVAVVTATATFALALGVVPVAPAGASGTKYPYVYTNPDGSKTIIPSRPTRVVILAGSDTVSGLGAHVVGAPQTSYYYPPNKGKWLNGGELNGVVTVGGYDPPNYEEIAALRPDLIIGGDSASIQASLSAIAPTVGLCCTNVRAPNFGFEDALLDLAPIFNATAHAHEIIARLHQRTTAVAPFVRGTSVAILEPLSPTNFLENNVNLVTNFELPLAGIFTLMGAKLETGGGGSTEDLPDVTAEKVLAITNPNTEDETTFKADPLYPEIPAVKRHQIYFTWWEGAGPVGTADVITQFSKEMFGVTPLEALLVGSGKHSAGRSGVADVDVGPTQKRVCWDITTTGNVGHPKTADVVDKHGTRLFALGTHYAATGCASISRSSGRNLIRSPARYRLSLDTARTQSILLGGLAPDSPAFAGNGKDTQYNQ